MDPTYFIVSAMVVSLVLFQANQRRASPVLSILNRWLRWLIFGFGLAKIVIDLGVTARPYWMLVLTFLLVYALVETIYRWLEIQALSLSPIPLFPRFRANAGGEEWPTHPRFVKTRDWLRGQGFHVVQSLKAEIAPSIHLRMSVYQDSSNRLRIQILFLPQPGGNIVMCASLSSQTPDGLRYVTDNLYLPFAGFYPENWMVDRSPWRRTLPALLRRHRQRVDGKNIVLQAWETDPLVDLNAQQQALEQVNTELGFLFPHHERDEHGKMTSEARYRVWKEAWLLNYFGRSARYF
ncbi:hypothetical protein [Synoicihabitans lomoniglobus]|uniref:Uncharacterized protein n=1 Tax=Synoicihabitans lomoniglobus TaxID=2909285 RepID=A0AAE9ZUF0_9BACT|nr:hypothetical protein [Opitutaceae bacterium LMO-M01]WED64501.1 hypothetical protein PXH66_19345 [Opitutaceae bacterium LMO-M01]